MRFLPEHPAFDELDSMDLSKLDYFYSYRVARRFNVYGHGHFVLACYAALPAVLTPDLLHKLWLNFKRYDLRGTVANIHPVAPADLLLSPLVEEIGFELYEMPEAIRHALLQFLKAHTSGTTPNTYGFYPLSAIANFLYDYARFDFTPENPDDDAFKEAQIWTALSYLNPNAAFEKVATAYQEALRQEDTNEQARCRDALRKMGARFTLDIVQRPEDIPPGFGAMNALASVVRDVVAGREAQGLEIFQKSLEQGASLTDTPIEAPNVVHIKLPQQAANVIERQPTQPNKQPHRAYLLIIDTNHSSRKNQNFGDMLDMLRNMLLKERLETIMLTGKQASKKAIIEALAQIAAKSTEQDEILVYVSAVWTERTDVPHFNCADGAKLNDREFAQAAAAIAHAHFALLLDVPYAAGPNWLLMTRGTCSVWGIRYSDRAIFWNNLMSSPSALEWFGAFSALGQNGNTLRQSFAQALRVFEDLLGTSFEAQSQYPKFFTAPIALNYLPLSEKQGLARLQTLLRQTGFYDGPSHGQWDMETAEGFTKLRQTANLPKNQPKGLYIQHLEERLKEQKKQHTPVFLMAFFGSEGEPAKLGRAEIESLLKPYVESGIVEVLWLDQADKTTLIQTFRDAQYRNRIELVYFAGNHFDLKGGQFGAADAIPLLDYQENIQLWVSNTPNSAHFCERLSFSGVELAIGAADNPTEGATADFGTNMFRSLLETDRLPEALEKQIFAPYHEQKLGVFQGFKAIGFQRETLGWNFAENMPLKTGSRQTRTSGKPKLYALAVGINAYDRGIIIGNTGRFSPLNACVADAEAFRAFLLQETYFDVHLQLLTDQEATKPNIVACFENHLAQAGPDDTVLFYFSGHGALEAANSVFWTAEQDQRLESLACFINDAQQERFMLADLELRYLIHRLAERTKAHILCILDTCYSGEDNTRREGYQQALDLGIAFPQRPWEGFLFSKRYQPSDFEGKTAQDVFPIERYVLITADEYHKQAFEEEGHGLLTKYLLQTLKQSGGNLSYRDLMSRIRNRVRYIHPQRPQLYMSGTAQEALQESGFLNKPIGAAALRATLVKDTEGAYWVNQGRLHGLEPGISIATGQLPNGETFRGIVQTVEPTRAVVKFEEKERAKLPQSHQEVTLYNLFQRLVRVHFVDKDGQDVELPRVAVQSTPTQRLGEDKENTDSSLKHFLAVLSEPENASFIVFEDDPSRATVALLRWHGLYYLCEPSNFFHPWVMPLPVKTPNAAETIAGYLRHMAQWHYAAQLKNRGPAALPDTALQVEFFDELDKPLSAQDQILRPVLVEQPSPQGLGVRWRGGLKAKLTNTAQQDLYVSTAYCSTDFSCSTTVLLDPAVALLEPGQTKWLFDHRKNPVIPLKLDETVDAFNWAESLEWIKLIFSAEIFDPTSLEQGALPKPSLAYTRGSLDMEAGENKPSSLQLESWNAHNFALVVRNPTFNNINLEELYQILNTTPAQHGAMMAHFMIGLYLEDGGQGRLKLKPALRYTRDIGKGGPTQEMVIEAAHRWLEFWQEKAEQWPATLSSAIDYKALRSEIQQLIAQARIEEALDKMVQIFPDAVQLQATYRQVKREKTLGLLDNDDWFKHQARTTDSALEMLKSIA